MAGQVLVNPCVPLSDGLAFAVSREQITILLSKFAPIVPICENLSDALTLSFACPVPVWICAPPHRKARLSASYQSMFP
jgi:hypothetical protein